jgi:hypothetical protein
MSVRIAKIGQHPVAQVLRDESTNAADRLAGTSVVGGDDLAQVLRVHAASKGGGADEICEQYSDLVTLRGVPFVIDTRQRCFRSGFCSKLSYGIEQLTTLPNERYAKVLQVISSQVKQDFVINLIVAKCRLVLSEAKSLQPTFDIHVASNVIAPFGAEQLLRLPFFSTRCLGLLHRSKKTWARTVVGHPLTKSAASPLPIATVSLPSSTDTPRAACRDGERVPDVDSCTAITRFISGANPPDNSARSLPRCEKQDLEKTPRAKAQRRQG